MRRNLVAQAARFRRSDLTGLHLLVQKPQLFLHQIELFLLAENRTIEFIDQMLGQAQLDFQFGQSVVHGSVFRSIFHMRVRAITSRRSK